MQGRGDDAEGSVCGAGHSDEYGGEDLEALDALPVRFISPIKSVFHETNVAWMAKNRLT